MRNLVEHFEGFVTVVEEDSFWARMEDMDGVEWEMELITSKVLQDTEYLKEGIPCYWSFFSDGTFDFNLIVEFWTQEQLDRVKAEAEEMAKKFKELPQAED